jgi:hypothetical protein
MAAEVRKQVIDMDNQTTSKVQYFNWDTEWDAWESCQPPSASQSAMSRLVNIWHCLLIHMLENLSPIFSLESALLNHSAGYWCIAELWDSHPVQQSQIGGRLNPVIIPFMLAGTTVQRWVHGLCSFTALLPCAFLHCIAHPQRLYKSSWAQVGQYFNLVKGLQGATNKTEQLAAMFNAGQAVILAMGMASIMFAAVLVGR